MILESIQLEHVGPFIRGARVGPFSRGLNILAAGNESGKSTLLRAAIRALFDRHNCRDAEIRMLRPIGTDLAPRVQVVFEVQEGRFQIDKTFWQSPRCLLSHWVNGAWKPVAEGDQADIRMQALLQSRIPGRGASQAANWGLTRYLWARQGELCEWPEWKDEAGRLIQTRLAQIKLDPWVDLVRQTMREIFLESFTPTGQVKVGGPLKRAEEELSRLDEQLAGIRSAQREMEETEAEYQRLAVDLKFFEEQCVRLEEEAETARQQALQAEQLNARLRALQSELETAQAALMTARQDSDRLDLDRRTMADLQSRLSQDRQGLEEACRLEAAAHALVQESETRLEQHRADRLRVQERLQQIRHQLKYGRGLQECRELEALLKNTSQAASQIQKLQEEKQRIPEIKPDLFRKLQILEEKIRHLQIQLESLGLVLTLTPFSKAKVQLPEENFEIEAGECHSVRAPQNMDLVLEGWGRLSIRSGSTEIQSLLEELRKSREGFHQLLLETGVAGLEEARRAMQARKELEGQLRGGQQILAALLGEWPGLEAIQKELGKRRTRLAALAAVLEMTDSQDLPALADLEAREQSLQTQFEMMEKEGTLLLGESRKIRDDLTRKSERRQKVESELLALQTTWTGLEDQVKRLLERYPQGLEAVLRDAQVAFVKAEARLAEARGQLPADYEKLPERNRRAAAAAQQARGQRDQKRTALARLEGHLKARGSEGLYSRETALLERRVTAQSALQNARDRGEAARLVHDLLIYHQQAATRLVLGPLEEKLSWAFAEISGDQHRRVFLDETLQIHGVGGNEQELVPFDHLSQGAKEQLLLCLRLAAARELAKTEPQLVVLDDGLVNTDPIRQKAVLDLLQQTAQELQILVLTCHPERYLGIGTPLSLQTTE